MDNEYNKLEKNYLEYILSDEKIDQTINIQLSDVAVIANLYYPDTLERYFAYFDNVPNNIFIYIISSNNNTWKVIEEYIKKRSQKHLQLIKKKNRGRDISALLIASRSIVEKYKIICFVHDKKTAVDYLEKDTEDWILNLWGNTLNSEGYIYNILNIFHIESNIGLLAPPPPIGEYMTAWYRNAWCNNYDNTRQLAKELNLNCEIDQNISPMTLGTVFWARTEAIKKLYLKKWKYEDFDDEPLAGDGTISHAIERILAYVVQDSGYDTGTIMNNLYAEKLILFLHKSMKKAFEILHEIVGIANIAETLDFSDRKEKILQFCKKNHEIYVYGAGEKGKNCLKLLQIIGYRPTCIVVSKKEIKENELNGIPIMELNEIHSFENIGIIIAVNYSMQDEIIQSLKRMNFDNFITYLSLKTERLIL